MAPSRRPTSRQGDHRHAGGDPPRRSHQRGHGRAVDTAVLSPGGPGASCAGEMRERVAAIIMTVAPPRPRRRRCRNGSAGPGLSDRGRLAFASFVGWPRSSTGSCRAPRAPPGALGSFALAESLLLSMGSVARVVLDRRDTPTAQAANGLGALWAEVFPLSRCPSAYAAPRSVHCARLNL